MAPMVFQIWCFCRHIGQKRQPWRDSSSLKRTSKVLSGGVFFFQKTKCEDVWKTNIEHHFFLKWSLIAEKIMNFIWKKRSFWHGELLFSLPGCETSVAVCCFEDWDFQEHHGDWYPEEGLHIPIPKRSSVLLGVLGNTHIFRNSSFSKFSTWFEFRFVRDKSSESTFHTFPNWMSWTSKKV